VVPAGLANHPKFKVLRKIGEGGMGAVYLAEHLAMERQVAIKVVNQALVGSTQALDRFHREMKVAARLDHPNIVRALDAETAGDLHFLVLEYVEGHSLERVVRQKGPLSVLSACRCARQVALALQHAHEKGMIHRDIKPQNLMVTRQGVVKVLDFGLARLAREQGELGALTQSGAFMGTPDYVAPEQALDAHRADIRADIYSLGCTLYYLLAGRPPFVESTAMKVVFAHVDQEASPLHEVRPEVPAELSAVVGRMMAKDPAARYQTPREVAETLAPFCKVQPGEDRKAVVLETPEGAARTMPAGPAAVGEAEWEAIVAAVGAEKPRPPVRELKQGHDGAWWRNWPWWREGAWRQRWPLLAASGAVLGMLLLGIIIVIKYRGADGKTRELSVEVRSTDDATKRSSEQGSKPAETLPARYKNSLGMEFALIPAGAFLMGSPESEAGRRPDEGPQHQVEITRPFYLGIHPVTQGQWQRLMDSNPSRFCSSGPDKDKVEGMDTNDFPVECVSWEDCQEFIRKLSELPEEKRSQRVYRLPTEAEWEYSCRGGASSYQVYAFGNTLAAGQANISGKLGRTCKVDSYQPNGFGLYDMHGNVGQWCADWLEADYYRNSPQQDPQGPAQGSFRVHRGGGWGVDPLDCRSASRFWLGPGNRFNDLGFRLALVPPSGQVR
jgi:formylglycine-generating enzyme required for sulfatase activity